ncbi:hypothetical protein SERLA73DRAFT_118588 [Serpula lacrymans var. lacrymans S7.3]|uniref:Uncharacterized protein n=1 Tax=Serpula lacrymans var. lacrymans (strain S7.3) TaxID=936435 RepID=F8PI43_SERL3|nr:hypothetical protein SERLA73DRAFT_118588 [Serpula lacrymans var. lacrymans S7.3]
MYAPKCAYTDESAQGHIFDDMWTADWWREKQWSLNKIEIVSPVILASDKTMLKDFQGDKSAWPVYLAIGDIAKDAMVLLGYLPVAKLDYFKENTRSLAAGYQMFHHCMSIMLRPLVAACKDRLNMICADGLIHRIHPILAAYVGNFPEQCLIACCKESWCPECVVSYDKQGDMVSSLLRDPTWSKLPYTNIFKGFTPDILHQLHKGAFQYHLEEMDLQLKAMASYPRLQHFKKGISRISQWTGSEHKETERVFVGLLAGGFDAQVCYA